MLLVGLGQRLHKNVSIYFCPRNDAVFDADVLIMR